LKNKTLLKVFIKIKDIKEEKMKNMGDVLFMCVIDETGITQSLMIKIVGMAFEPPTFFCRVEKTDNANGIFKRGTNLTLLPYYGEITIGSKKMDGSLIDFNLV
jgi:hypothetical protein